MFVVGHVNSDFSMLKGARRDPKSNEQRYISKGKVMGTIKSDIVHDSTWRYEGVLFETTVVRQKNEGVAEAAPFS